MSIRRPSASSAFSHTGVDLMQMLGLVVIDSHTILACMWGLRISALLSVALFFMPGFGEVK